MINDSGTARFPVNDHTEQRVRKLTRSDQGLTVPPPPDPTLGIWLVSMGFRLQPLTWRLCLSVQTPHWAILPWGKLFSMAPLGLGQNARCKDLLLATGLTGQLQKGQFSSHWSTDRCTLNIHRSHRDPVILVLVLGPGNTGHTGYTGSDQAQPVTLGPSVTGTRLHRAYRVHRVRPGATGHTGQTGQHWSESSKGTGQPVPGPV